MIRQKLLKGSLVVATVADLLTDLTRVVGAYDVDGCALLAWERASGNIHLYHEGGRADRDTQVAFLEDLAETCRRQAAALASGMPIMFDVIEDSTEGRAR